jgi:demethylmenaquinone methyltransferase/2-methoxy-6-polyprenyl-1,4-benzoquinol methylase
MLEDGFEKVIGLDPSRILLRSTKTRLRDHFYPIQGVAENLPFRKESIAGIITCYSLRDVRDKAKSISEFARVLIEKGRLEIVDVGKPDNEFLRRLVGLYVVFVMPVVARFFIGRRAQANPFRMIIPTFQRLPSNRSLTRLAAHEFGSSQLDEFLLGGLVIVEATRADGSHC